MIRILNLKYLTFLAIIAVGCKSIQPTNVSTAPVSQDKFFDTPFGHDESIASFKKTLPSKTKIRKLVKRNDHYPEKVDTIYQFIYRHSEVFVYKSSFNKEILMAGVIADPQIKLINGVTTGISKEQLYGAIKGIKKTEADTVKISTSDNTRKFSFIFKKGKLKKVTFASYYD